MEADLSGGELRRIVDEKMKSLLNSGKGLVDALRSVVEENLKLRNDLHAATGMLSRVYAIIERLQSNPEFMAAAGLPVLPDGGVSCTIGSDTEDTGHDGEEERCHEQARGG